MTNFGTTSEDISRRFAAHGFTVELLPGPSGTTLTIAQEGKQCCSPVAVRIVVPAQAAAALSQSGAMPIIHFPGQSRHPAGLGAGISWFNDEGLGWIRLLQPKLGPVLLPLQGWEQTLEAAVVPTRGRRGPPKSMDLWLAIVALLHPGGIDGVQLALMTGINKFNVYDWLSRATKSGLLARWPGLTGRREQYVVPPTQIPTLGEYIRNAWDDWQQHRTMARLRATERFFVATAEWPVFSAAGGDRILATGVTWLEGHDGGEARLTPLGTIPRVSCICATSTWERLVGKVHLAAHSHQERPYDSLARVIPDMHPLWDILQRRAALLSTPLWPAGLRVLDGLRDPEARVRDAAEEVWHRWLESHRIQAQTLHDALPA